MQESKSLRSSFTRSSAHVFLGKFVRYILQYATQILLINLLLPSDFGLMRYVTLLVGMASLINEMGLTTAIVQKQDIGTEEIAGAFMGSVIWGLLLYIAIFLTAPMMASFFNNQQLVRFLRIGSLLIPAASVCAVPRALLQRQMRFGKLALIEAMAAVISSSVMFVFAIKGYGTWSLVVGGLVQESLSLVVLLSMVQIPGLKVKALLQSKKILWVGAGLVFLRVVDYFRFSMPFFVIGKLFDEKSLGLFSISYDLSLFPQVIINAVLGNVAISTFSRLQNDKNRTEAGFSQLTLFASVLVIPVLLLMSFLSVEILHTICFLKKNNFWFEASGLMRWMSLMGLFYAVSLFPSAVWLSNKKIVQSIIWSWVMLITTVIAIFTGFKWGIEGIAVALFVRSAVCFPVFAYVNYRVTGIKIAVYLKAIYPALICGLIMLIPIILIQNLITGISLSRHITVLLVSCITGGIIYLLLISFFLRSSLAPFLSLLRRPKETYANESI